MTSLVFYEKPGCVGNARQKSLLLSRGIELEVRDLLATKWKTDELRSFFGPRLVREWFNNSAPKVKSGELDIDGLDLRQALILMQQEPLLIRRPLLDYGGIRQSGFEPGPVFEALGIKPGQRGDLQSCPMSDGETPCRAPS